MKIDNNNNKINFLANYKLINTSIDKQKSVFLSSFDLT